MRVVRHNLEAGNEAALLRTAMAVLEAHAPVKCGKEATRGREGCGYIVRMKVRGRDIRLCAEVKRRLTKTDETLAMFRQDNTPYPFLLVTGYVPFEAATRLRDAGVQFVDTAGNAYINQPMLYVFVKGNRPPKEEAAPRTPRLFKGAGLKVVYLLLCRPGLVNRPYRELADMAGVAVGTVSGAITEMARKGFLLDMGKEGKMLLDRKVLLERWAAAYPDYLRPKLFLGRFRGDGGWWKDVDLEPAVAQWGGEVAAAKLTGYLKPGTVTLYADKGRLPELVLANRLKKDPQGDVEVFRRFWPVMEGFGEGDTVHPLLVYADLAAMGEQRTMQTAKMVYEKYLDRYFGEG